MFSAKVERDRLEVIPNIFKFCMGILKLNKFIDVAPGGGKSEPAMMLNIY